MASLSWPITALQQRLTGTPAAIAAASLKADRIGATIARRQLASAHHAATVDSCACCAGAAAAGSSPYRGCSDLVSHVFVALSLRSDHPCCRVSAYATGASAVANLSPGQPVTRLAAVQGLLMQQPTPKSIGRRWLKGHPLSPSSSLKVSRSRKKLHRSSSIANVRT